MYVKTAGLAGGVAGTSKNKIEMTKKTWALARQAVNRR